MIILAKDCKYCTGLYFYPITISPGSSLKQSKRLPVGCGSQLHGCSGQPHADMYRQPRVKYLEISQFSIMSFRFEAFSYIQKMCHSRTRNCGGHEIFTGWIRHTLKVCEDIFSKMNLYHTGIKINICMKNGGSEEYQTKTSHGFLESEPCHFIVNI